MSETPPIRYKLTVAYRGNAYHGWQRQQIAGDHSAATELPTVQNTLRLALQRVVGHPVNVVGASRTDSGVHAEGQAASFTTTRQQIEPDKLIHATNAKLPPDIAVIAAHRVPIEFDVIGDTVSKLYRYTIYNAAAKDVFAGDVAMYVVPKPKPLDVDAMNDAARRLLGEHDFTSFAKPGHGRDSTVRTVDHAEVRRDGDRVLFSVAGNGFLWHQVRIFTGTLLRVGLGKWRADDIDRILAARDREAAGPTAPAHGLCLLHVRHAANSSSSGNAVDACRVKDA